MEPRAITRAGRDETWGGWVVRERVLERVECTTIVFLFLFSWGMKGVKIFENFEQRN